jgi:hypothetical protein
MASIQSIGAIVTVNRAFDEPDPNDSHVNLHVRYFAKLDTGLTVIDPNPQSQALGIARDQMVDLEGMLGIPMARMGELSAEHRLAPWEGVLEALKKVTSGSDPETLQRLPFEVLADGEVRELIDAARGS